ncbi:hypothetical protein [Actinomycetospora flava]|uniref:Zinc finger protein n=1 Tax=Actinomycetospora flava TaxID=3129232 RepID=A0ABU8M5I8_9PSEU
MMSRPARTGPSRAGAALLAGWEAAAELPAAARPAALLPHLAGVPGLEAALDLPVGRCAALAAASIVKTAGGTLEVLLRCPGCRASSEVTLDLTPLAAGGDADGGARAVVPLALGEIEVRAPTTRDLLATRTEPDGVTALLARCLRHADGRELSKTEMAGLAPEEIDAVDAAAREQAGSAGTVVRTSCPGCGAAVAAPLDLGALWWQQVAEAAHRLLAEVATLARSFGWAEREVLELSPTRRAAYLALAEESSAGVLTAATP